MLNAETGRIDNVGVTFALVFSFALHLLLLSIQMMEIPPRPELRTPSLEVVLVNSKTESKPVQATVLAQNDIDGGGTSKQNKLPTTFEPVSPKKPDLQQVEQMNQRVQQLREESTRVMTQNQESNFKVNTAPDTNGEASQVKPTPNKPLDIEALKQAARNLEGAIDKQIEAEAKRPKKEFEKISAKKYIYAQYIEGWRQKIERIGNLNYPADRDGKRLKGKLILTVEISRTGELIKVAVDRRSDNPVLDAAAMRIVKNSGNYLPFPNDFPKDIDILVITRTWTFAEEVTGQ